jgi:hypothetical protein
MLVELDEALGIQSRFRAVANTSIDGDVTAGRRNNPRPSLANEHTDSVSTTNSALAVNSDLPERALIGFVSGPV